MWINGMRNKQSRALRPGLREGLRAVSWLFSCTQAVLQPFGQAITAGAAVQYNLSTSTRSPQRFRCFLCCAGRHRLGATAACTSVQYGCSSPPPLCSEKIPNTTTTAVQCPLASYYELLSMGDVIRYFPPCVGVRLHNTRQTAYVYMCNTVFYCFSGSPLALCRPCALLLLFSQGLRCWLYSGGVWCCRAVLSAVTIPNERASLKLLQYSGSLTIMVMLLWFSSCRQWSLTMVMLWFSCCGQWDLIRPVSLQP